MPILNNKGFTIIELLIVIAILGILAMIGFSTFSGIQQSARDAKRKADVDAITKVYESKYDLATGIYGAISGTDFTSNEIPKDPDGTDYVVNRDSDTNTKALVVCSNRIEKVSETYCKYSANGDVSALPTPAPYVASTPTQAPTSVPTASPTSAPTAPPTPAPTPTPSPSPSPKTVFVTSGNYRSDLFSPPGLVGADASCRVAADTAGLAGTYKAWLSDDTGSPLTRFTPSVSGYKKVDDTMVANSWADLLDGSLLSGIDKSESGGNRSGVYVFSNTTAAGGIQNTNTNGHCNRWAYFGWQFYGSNLGLSGQTDSTWTYSVSGDCNWPRALYCFEQ